MQVEFEQFMAQMKALSKSDSSFTQAHQIERLTGRVYVNPYDVLDLGAEASEPEIKKRFRMLSMLVHPDKNKHEKAAEAFGIADKAYKTLMDLDKRRTFQRVMREAVEQVDLKREKENERLKKLGRAPLPEDTRHGEVQNMCA